MTGRPDLGGHSSNWPAGGRAGLRDAPLRITPQTELEPLQVAEFDPRDFAVNTFVIIFFSLVFVAPLVVLGAVAKGFLR